MGNLTYSIGDLAREFGVTTRAVRFYEDQGLLNPRRAGRQRIFSNRDRIRLKLTLRGKRLGFSLSEIRELFDLYDQAKDEKPQISQFLVILSNRRAALEQQREDIDAVLGEIQAFENQCRAILEAERRRQPTDNVGDSPVGAAEAPEPLVEKR